MRPTRLELTGFGSFREPTTIDLTDAELFVVVGPTGAGKSTVIDALVFALYGSVPRYDDRRLVAPVINQGRVEAKVRLDFVVAGVTYTAVRVVRRTATGGATTKEARLEALDGQRSRTLAGNEKELTSAVERLLGLSFEHFTRCVVLPQGAFAEFLHARPAQRHDLLVELLGIEVYRRIARRARERARDAAARVEQTRNRLSGDLTGATANALVQASGRVDRLTRVRERIVAAQPRLDELREHGVACREAALVAQARRALLDAVEAPPDVDALARQFASAAHAFADAVKAADKAEWLRQSAEDARASLPDATVLVELRRLTAEHTRRVAEHEPAGAALRRAIAGREAAEVAHRTAVATVSETRGALERAQRQDLARALSHGLSAGDECPVCAQTVTAVPHHDGGVDLDRVRQRRDAAEDEERRAAVAVRAGESDVARQQAAVDGIARAIADLDDASRALADRHDVDVAALPQLLVRAEEADREVTSARVAERAARTQVRAAEQAQASLANRQSGAWSQFDATRDRLAALTPPPATRDDLATAWSALLAWVAERMPVLDRALRDAEHAVTQVKQQWLDHNGALVAACRDEGVTVERHDPLSASAAALERARADHAQLAHQVQTAERLRASADADQVRSATATQLGQHLGAKRFEQWLLYHALGQLVDDASVRLRDLSSGAYSLRVDEVGGFQVVDHRNADELRSARTLSGGETFLASLALALSLADHVAQLAAGSSARLDTLLLDEGFGTLDPDTLDVVAAALEELGAHGRMVGLVTHVRDLAERMPVRFEVRRTAETSTVHRTEQ